LHQGFFDEPFLHDNCIFAISIVSFRRPGFREPSFRIELDSSQVALADLELQRPFFREPSFELYEQSFSEALPPTVRAYRDRDQVIMVLPVIDYPIGYDLVVQSEDEKGVWMVSG